MNLGLVSCFNQRASNGYISNAFSVRDHNGTEILSNRDIKCVSLNESSDKNSNVLFTLSDISSRFFHEYTKNNTGKILSISICGGTEQKPKIMSVIPNGKIAVPILDEHQIKCLKNSFTVNKPCSDCPACRN
ncbi:MAG: hypothetical protein HYS98_01860 [Deltaproteobacteria bacterium]|nr:hypothetical protein [Deltaproteobacteria bacterium]